MIVAAMISPKSRRASLRIRKWIEEAFSWAKTVAGFGRTKLRCAEPVAIKFALPMAAYKLVRMPRLPAAA